MKKVKGLLKQGLIFFLRDVAKFSQSLDFFTQKSCDSSMKSPIFALKSPQNAHKCENDAEKTYFLMVRSCAVVDQPSEKNFYAIFSPHFCPFLNVPRQIRQREKIQFLKKKGIPPNLCKIIM